VFNPVILMALLSRNDVVRIFLVDCFVYFRWIISAALRPTAVSPADFRARSQLMRPPHQLPLLLALHKGREMTLCGECEFVKLRTHPTEKAVCSSEFPPVKHASSSPRGRQKPWPMGMLRCGKSRGSFVSVRYLSALADAQYIL
jgi:hypothetical protein